MLTGNQQSINSIKEGTYVALYQLNSTLKYRFVKSRKYVNNLDYFGIPDKFQNAGINSPITRKLKDIISDLSTIPKTRIMMTGLEYKEIWDTGIVSCEIGPGSFVYELFITPLSNSDNVGKLIKVLEQ